MNLCRSFLCICLLVKWADTAADCFWLCTAELYLGEAFYSLTFNDHKNTFCEMPSQKYLRCLDIPPAFHIFSFLIKFVLTCFRLYRLRHHYAMSSLRSIQIHQVHLTSSLYVHILPQPSTTFYWFKPETSPEYWLSVGCLHDIYYGSPPRILVTMNIMNMQLIHAMWICEISYELVKT